ncbi:MAG TPA: aconitase X catalytic domain-containing protein [Desulfatiglandales bacterium]|nr:aconitase X catalytic domain-containing protein [Desulfatiglandales bacterium]
MLLTDEEKAMLDGSRGESVRKAMEIIVRLGEIYGAERLVEFTSGHIDGNIDKEHNQTSIEFLENLALEGISIKAFVTLNSVGLDRERYEELGFSMEDFKDQVRLNHVFESIGCIGLYSCIPYFGGNLPRFGEHVCWSDSATIPFVNSVVGARSSREAGLSALMAAIVGRTPLYSYHLQENRRGQILVQVEASLKGIHDYCALGYAVGEKVAGKVPVFEGLDPKPGMRELLSLGTGMGTSGSVGMYHITGITPEASTREAAFHGKRPEETISITAKDLDAVYRTFNDAPGDDMDFVALGCPHNSLRQIQRIVEVLDGRRIHENVRMWVHTAAPIRTMANRMGLTECIGNAGGHITADICSVCAPVKKLGAQSVATDSVKQAFYSHIFNGFKTRLGSVETVVESAICGKWIGD